MKNEAVANQGRNIYKKANPIICYVWVERWYDKAYIEINAHGSQRIEKHLKTHIQKALTRILI